MKETFCIWVNTCLSHCVKEVKTSLIRYTLFTPRVRHRNRHRGKSISHCVPYFCRVVSVVGHFDMFALTETETSMDLNAFLMAYSHFSSSTQRPGSVNGCSTGWLSVLVSVLVQYEHFYIISMYSLKYVLKAGVEVGQCEPRVEIGKISVSVSMLVSVNVP